MIRTRKYIKIFAVFSTVLLLFAAGCGKNPAETAVSSGVPTETSVAQASALPTLPQIEPRPSGKTDPAESSAALPESTPAETVPETPQEATSEPEKTTEAPTEEPTTPEPTTTEPPATQAPTKEGLWDPVPTAEAVWAVREDNGIIYTNEDFGFTTYVSPYDFDGDGIEDQADILQGAKDYVATRPVYDSSAYYAGGWPNDGRGVCTDVVAFALRAAGYDLQELVARDVAKRPEAYPRKNDGSPDVGDRNIDYRRTRNLQPFFETYFEKLTLDPYDYEAWQPGDIVLFAHPEKGMWPGHVAIVSDRRASDGLPYLIHHTDNDRISYEQDFLTTPKRILVGHYRVGNLAATSLFP